VKLTKAVRQIMTRVSESVLIWFRFNL